MNPSRFTTILFSLVFTVSIIASERHVFRKLDTNDGMSNDNVKSILKDKAGFLWVGTASGLNRYDGYEFKQYNIKTPENETNDYLDDIWSLQEDADGNIWVRSNKRYSVFNRDKDIFSVDVSELLSSYGIDIPEYYCVYVDRGKNLWILTDDTIHFYNMSEGSHKSVNHSIKFLLDNLDISDDPDYLYILLNTGKICRIDKSRLQIGYMQPPTEVNRVNHIYADFQHGLWLFSDHDNDIYYKKDSGPWDKPSLPSTNLTQSKGIRCILDDKSGHVWIGTDHNGLYVYNQFKATMESFIHDSKISGTLPSNNVSCIYQDDDNTIWFGHNKSGISFCNDSQLQFDNLGLFDADDITALLLDKRNNLWVGTDGNGLFRKKVGDKSHAEKISSVFNGSIICLDEDSTGMIYAGCYGNGLYWINGDDVNHFTTENSPLISDMVWDVQTDKTGNVWIATLNGTQYFDPKSGRFMSVVASDGPSINSMSLYYDGDDTMYIGTFEGFYKVDIHTKRHEHCFSNYKKTQSFKQGFVSSILKDTSGHLWLGHNRGITVWNTVTDSLYYIDHNYGLCDNMVRTITEDADGHIWVSTSNGISIISPKWGNEGNFSYNIRNYTKKHGLKSSFFNSNAVAKMPDGNFIFGTSNGCVTFHPKRIFNSRRNELKVIFTKLYVGAKPISVDSLYDGRILLKSSLEKTSTLTFDHDDNLITIEFTACDLTNQYNLEYDYKLEGLDNQWLHTGDNKVTFASIPEGKYRLLVKACLPNGECSETSGIDIIIRPPFYLSWWAYTIYILFIIGCVYAVYFGVRNKHRQKMDIQKQEFENEQKAKINEIKFKFFTNISHDLRTPLTLIMVPLQVLMSRAKDETSKKMLNTMHQNALHLLNLINSLLDLRKLDVGAESLHCSHNDFIHFVKSTCASFEDYASSRNIKFDLDCSLSELSFDFDIQKVKKIMNNLLSNAFKYTPDGGHIRVSLERNDNFVTISVADTGEGIDDKTKKYIFERFYQGEQSESKTGSGIGLHIVSEYVHMHGGEISVTDNTPQGSTFTFSIPLQNCGPVTDSVADRTDDEATDETTDETELQQTDIDNPESEKKANILLVDDNKEYLDIIASVLSDEYNVLTADNGEKALELLDKENINLIISDVMMPGIDGMELCRRIKSNICWSHIPVILLTAKGAEESRIEGLELGADDYITKPFNYQLLRLRIHKFIELFERNHRMFKNQIDVEPSEITITSLDEKLVEKAIKIVEDHMEDPEFSVEVLSLELALSRGYLYKKLMAITGKGPAEFIRTIRLKRARQLLAKSQLQIAEVAYKCGFNSPKRFAQNFRNEFGMLPSEFLKSQL